MTRTVHVALAALGLLLAARPATAQLGGRGPAGGGQGQRAPTQSSPTQNKTVGPRSGDDDDTGRIQVTQRAEPVAAPPTDPLEIPPEVKDRIGTDSDMRPPPPTGQLERSYFPLYQESAGTTASG